MRKSRVSDAFFTTPGEFSMSDFNCWSVGCVVGAFLEGGLSVAFPLLVDCVAGITFDLEITLLRGYKPMKGTLVFLCRK